MDRSPPWPRHTSHQALSPHHPTAAHRPRMDHGPRAASRLALRAPRQSAWRPPASPDQTPPPALRPRDARLHRRVVPRTHHGRPRPLARHRLAPHRNHHPHPPRPPRAPHLPRPRSHHRPRDPRPGITQMRIRVRIKRHAPCQTRLDPPIQVPQHTRAQRSRPGLVSSSLPRRGSSGSTPRRLGEFSKIARRVRRRENPKVKGGRAGAPRPPVKEPKGKSSPTDAPPATQRP